VTPEFLERTVDKRGRKVGVVRRRQLKKVIALQTAMTKKVVSFLQEKNGRHRQLPPRVTPTLVTAADNYLCHVVRLLLALLERLPSAKR